MVPPHHNNEEHGHSDEIHSKLDAAELKEYIEHNLKHLEEHIKSFTKLEAKIEDSHATQSLRSAINLLKQGVLELKNVLTHLDE